MRPCVGIDSWIAAIVAGRPYADRDALIATADRASATWTAAEVEGALADHPRIGERPSGSGAGAAMSRSEQAVSPRPTPKRWTGWRTATAGTRRGSGGSTWSAPRGAPPLRCSTSCKQRLTNDPATELAVTKGQLAEIATLRLKALIARLTR